MTAHPIEVESYRIMSERVDLSAWPPPARAVVARMIHASADVEYASTARLTDDAVAAGIDAVRAGAPVICDSHMVRVGITGVPARCLLDEIPEAPPGSTRAAAAIRVAARRHPDGAVFVIGNAPSALTALLEIPVRPALVVGLPVGFVGAAEAKAALRACGWPSITNTGEKGGSAVAAAAANALVRLAKEQP
ncbi:MAG TPA: precorrin-8X methylmutase [Acidimicrobiales bacterium]